MEFLSCVIEKTFGTGLGGCSFCFPRPLGCAEWQGDFDIGLFSLLGVYSVCNRTDLLYLKQVKPFLSRCL